MEMEGALADSLHPTRRGLAPVQPHWTHLLIDEAAQGSEPELCIASSVVLPPPEYVGRGTFVPQLVLCGDPNQRLSYFCTICLSVLIIMVVCSWPYCHI